MSEKIYYDDDPADTAAFGWLCSNVGLKTIKNAVDDPEAALKRAFRTGYLIGFKKIKNEPCEKRTKL